MLFSLTKGEEPPFYLISGNEYSIGRKQNSVDICLEDDESISRLHARIKVGPNNAFVIDNGSKYGTSHQGKPLSAKAEVLLEDNDIIKFGVFESVFRFQKVKIVTSTSGLEQTITDDLKPTFLFLGAQLTKVWSDNCTHLTVQTIVLTFKILLALIDNKPIVTPQYWSKIAESVRNRQQGPSLKLFKPPITELLLENELDICYNEKRSTLFLGKVLVFPTNKLMERVKEIVLKTGGSFISWEENQLTVPEIFNGFDKYIFIQMKGEKEGPTFKEAVDYLKQINQRAIPMAEFGMAVLLSCCDKNCNPNFDRMGQVFGKHTQRGDRHTANITLAPETQSQMNPSIESLKQEIEIPATLESDIGDLPEHLPSTSSGFKRPPEKDCLNFNPVKKTKVERKEEESSLRKRKCVINYPNLKTICYHPSLLPRHRGASSINWTLIEGDKRAGLTIFWADDGLDTGPILLQEECEVFEDDNVDSLYNRFLYPVGINAVARAVDLVADGTAPKVPQPEKWASYDPMLNKPDLQRVDFSKSAKEIHDFIRGMDSVPGASISVKLPGNDSIQEILVFGSSLWKNRKPDNGREIEIIGENNGNYGIIHENGLILFGSDNGMVNVKKVQIAGRRKLASEIDQKSEVIDVEFTSEEKTIIESLRDTWISILARIIDDETNFFECGAQSMDVVRLVEDVKDRLNLENLENDDVFQAPTFGEFCTNVILKLRGGSKSTEIEYRAVEIKANKIDLKIPCQLFINGEFVDAEDGKTLPSINPADGSVICDVQCGSVNDVNKAVSAAKIAFESGEWSKISARERGQLMYKLADLMHQHREELATIESLDSGAVYTLALKTHVGMSIETWRYFAGWTDKIQGLTVPVSNARPNKNLTFTKREPIGVCGLITPWNYPLMMFSWKMAACLAAGNTVLIKPAQVCPLTALKFAELSAKAGFPPGVINVLPGTGSVTGQAIASHPDIRKLGFTGSTDIGKVIMKSCAESNLKKVSLELGGKSPLVIFADCDLDKAVRLGMQSVFFNKGENCIAAGRLFVESSIHDEFVRRVVQETRKIKIGDPLDRSTAHGPQNHLNHLNKLLEFVENGVKEGAKLEYGGKKLNRPGYFFEPTIFSEVEDYMYVAKEESFGPIMIISRFDNGDIDGVLKRANATEYGLASGVFTKDISKALRFADKVEAGTVFINTYNKTDVAAPFGGCKQSGFGKDLGQEALNEYLKTKCVTIEY